MNIFEEFNGDVQIKAPHTAEIIKKQSRKRNEKKESMHEVLEALMKTFKNIKD